MLRHTALFIHRDTTADGEKLAMLRGLAYLRMECAGVHAADYGDDILGGSGRLLEIPPWKRTPRWRARLEGPPSSYDVALHLDFEDERGMAAYDADEAHRGVARFNASVSVDELTARVDWLYDGPPLIERGRVRHTAMFVWVGDADPDARSAAFDAVRSFAAASGVESVTVGESIGSHSTDFDWILDVQFADTASAQALVGGAVYADAMRVVAPATKYEWTARVTHVMRGL
jgi:hypothetical protein